LVLLNSKLLSYYFLKNTAKSVRKLFPKIILNDLRKFPIKFVSPSEQTPFIQKADEMLLSFDKLNELINNFLNLLQSKFPIEKLSKNLQSWHTLDFKGFLKELKKAKVSLTLPEEAEWMAYFNGEKEKAQALQNEIDRLDKAIDGMVYGLYGLSDEEIAIVESS
jgi:hypothetical protein